MSGDGEAFLERWARLKREQAAAQPAPELPPPEQLAPGSDFGRFMGARVDTETRRTALKTLFTDSHFNVPDPFEAYSEDYTVSETIPMEMLKTLNHAQKLLFDDPEKTVEAAAAQSGAESDAAQPEAPSQDLKNAVGKQDA